MKYITIILLLLLTITPAIAAPTAWVMESTDLVGRQDAPGTVQSIELYGSRGEWESAQVVIRNGKDIVPVMPTIEGLHITPYIVWYGPHGPDALLPNGFPFTVGGRDNQPVWIDVYIEYTAQPGVHTGTIIFTGSSGSVSVPLTVTVWDIDLPLQPSLRSSVKLDTTRRDPAANKMFSDRRMQPMYIPKLPTLADSRQETVNVSGFWADNGQGGVYKPKATAEEVQVRVDQYEERLDKYALLADEPSTRYPYFGAEMRDYAEFIILNPFVRTFVTTAPDREDWSWTEQVAGLHFQWDQSGINGLDLLAYGREPWAYTCLQQGGPNYPHWIIGYGPMPFRAWAWILYKQYITGWYYWRGDRWDPNQWDSVTAAWASHPGEGILFYNHPLYGYIPSIRLMWLRDSMEDYEYLILLEAAGYSDLARAMASEIAPDWTNWTRDPQEIENARFSIGVFLDGLGEEPPVDVTTVTVTDDDGNLYVFEVEEGGTLSIVVESR
jgi:hypothetical protein